MLRIVSAVGIYSSVIKTTLVVVVVVVVVAGRGVRLAKISGERDCTESWIKALSFFCHRHLTRDDDRLWVIIFINRLECN